MVPFYPECVDLHTYDVFSRMYCLSGKITVENKGTKCVYF